MADPVRWRLRPDLLWETVHSGGALLSVVKDPVTGQFFHFDPREVSILKLLDGIRGPAEVLAAVRQSRPDEFFSTDALLRFLVDARRNGLLLLRGAAATPAAADSTSSRRRSLLAWKLPVWNPARTLVALRPVAAMAFTRLAAIAWLVVVLSAAALVAGRFDDVTDRLPAAHAWATPAMLLTILGVLFVCKVIHELAHALAADRFGVRVQECGLMLFYFLPSFYCDVSDAWLVRSPSKRILISAAGMLAELGLAAVATWLWWFSNPGPVQSICLAVMVTCSVNTLLLNGNPLMRFDGYFVLVDLLGMPNLAARSTEWWRSGWNRLVWGLSGQAEPDRHDAILAIYGAAAFVYRLLVVSTMLWGIHTALDSRGAGVVSGALALSVVGGLVIGGAQAASQPWRDPLTRKSIRTGRSLASLLVILVILSLAALVPLPRSVEADFVIEPASATSVYVQSGGQLQSILPVGSSVKQGDQIAVLEDFEAIRRLKELEAQQSIARARLESASVRRTIDPAAGREIPALTESLAAIAERLELAQKRAAELVIVAPCDGRVLPPPNTLARTASVHVATEWSGSPFDAVNLGCTLKQGTALALVAPSIDLSAVGYISQRKIELVRPGQAVRLALDGAADEVRAGTIEEISPAPVDELPRELAATARVPVSPQHQQGSKPLEPMYRVRIRLDDPTRPAAIGSLGTARITTARTTLLGRCASFLTETFRVDL